MAKVKMSRIIESYDTGYKFDLDSLCQYMDMNFILDCIEHWIQIGKHEDNKWLVISITVVIMLLSTIFICCVTRRILCRN